MVFFVLPFGSGVFEKLLFSLYFVRPMVVFVKIPCQRFWLIGLTRLIGLTGLTGICGIGQSHLRELKQINEIAFVKLLDFLPCQPYQPYQPYQPNQLYQDAIFRLPPTSNIEVNVFRSAGKIESMGKNRHSQNSKLASLVYRVSIHSAIAIELKSIDL